jgi:hypothetical protein
MYRYMFSVNVVRLKRYMLCHTHITLNNKQFSVKLITYISSAVPLHAMEVHGGRGGFAPTHS